MWREILSRYDIGDVASVVFANRCGVWGFLDLWRTASQPPYGAGDASFLRAVGGHPRDRVAALSGRHADRSGGAGRP